MHVGVLARTVWKPAFVRPDVKRMVELGPMPDETTDPTVEVVETFHRAVESLPTPLTEDEAIARLDSFPPGDDGSLFEMGWPLLHAIETAPYGKRLIENLDDQSGWVRFPRERTQRGGLL